MNHQRLQVETENEYWFIYINMYPIQDFDPRPAIQT